MGGIYPQDLPGVPENNTYYYDASQIVLESYGYVESKPYPRALLIGRNPGRNRKWVGYPNTMVAMKSSDARAVVIPKIPINKHNFNAPVPFPTNASFAGAAPVKGIFTGVSEEVTSCH